jgi:hypothetical protein
MLPSVNFDRGTLAVFRTALVRCSLAKNIDPQFEHFRIPAPELCKIPRVRTHHARFERSDILKGTIQVGLRHLS